MKACKESDGKRHEQKHPSVAPGNWRALKWAAPERYLDTGNRRVDRTSARAFPQPSYGHTCLFSPVCIVMWRVSFEFSLNACAAAGTSSSAQRTAVSSSTSSDMSVLWQM